MASKNHARFLTGFTPTGDLEHDLVATTLLALEAEVDTKLGWDAPGLLLQISAVSDGPLSTVALRPVPAERWLPPGLVTNPARELLEFAQSLNGPEGFTPRAFADCPEGRCGFAFVSEVWMVTTPVSAPLPRRPLATHPKRVEARMVAATDIGGREYWIKRERGGSPQYLAGARMIDRIPTALWLLTAAMASGRFEL